MKFHLFIFGPSHFYPVAKLAVSVLACFFLYLKDSMLTICINLLCLFFGFAKTTYSTLRENSHVIEIYDIICTLILSLLNM